MKLTRHQSDAVKKAVATAIENLVWLPDHRKSVHAVEPKLVVKLTRRFKADKRNTREDFVLTVGAPNYIEREWLRRKVLKVGQGMVCPWPKKRSPKGK